MERSYRGVLTTGAGRSERAFLTSQDRWRKETALAGITRPEAANCRLAQSFIAQHNRRFAIKPEPEHSAFVHDTTGAWREILCVREGWTVGHGNTVSWHRLRLQLPPSLLVPCLGMDRCVRGRESPPCTVTCLGGQIAGFYAEHQKQTDDPSHFSDRWLSP